MIKSIVICQHGKLGYTASLRFEDSSRDIDISSSNHYGIYRSIDSIVERDMKSENNTKN